MCCILAVVLKTHLFVVMTISYQAKFTVCIRSTMQRQHRRRNSLNLRGHDILSENYVWKINKLPEFYMILVRKIIKIPEFLWYLPENQQNSLILHEFCPKNARILHKNCPTFFPQFQGGGHVPPPSAPRLLRLWKTSKLYRRYCPSIEQPKYTVGRTVSDKTRRLQVMQNVFLCV